jgi:hypothetical protein
MLSDQLSKLRAAILEAFADVPPPRPDRVDLYSGDELSFAGKQRLGNDTTTNWTQIPNEWIEANCEELALVSAETFHYYLPALLLYAVDNWKSSNVWNWTLIIITPDDDIKRQRMSLADYHRARFGLLTQLQMQVIYSFLDLVLEDTQDWIHWTTADRGKRYLMALFAQIQPVSTT